MLPNPTVLALFGFGKDHEMMLFQMMVELPKNVFLVKRNVQVAQKVAVLNRQSETLKAKNSLSACWVSIRLPIYIWENHLIIMPTRS